MNNQYLAHHGIKGQRWGVRRFQNADGTRTAAGKARERNGEQGSASAAKKTESSDGQKRGLTDAQKATLKKVAIAGAAAAAIGLAAYGAYKYSDAIKTEAWNMTVDNGMAAASEARHNSQFWEESLREATGNDAKVMIEMDNARQKVVEREMADLNKTAEYNSSNLKRARATLKGQGKESLVEREAKGIADAYTDKEGRIQYEGRTAYEKQLKKKLNDLGYLTYESNVGGGRSVAIGKIKK